MLALKLGGGRMPILFQLIMTIPIPMIIPLNVNKIWVFSYHLNHGYAYSHGGRYLMPTILSQMREPVIKPIECPCCRRYIAVQNIIREGGVPICPFCSSALRDLRKDKNVEKFGSYGSEQLSKPILASPKPIGAKSSNTIV